MSKLLTHDTRLTRPNTASKDEGGWFLISAIVMITFLSAIGFSIAGLVALQYQHTRLEMYDQNAQLVAEAGVEQTVTELNSDNSFAGYTSPQTFFDDSTQGKGTYITTVTTNADGTSKTIVSYGKVYQNDSAATPYFTRGIKVTVVGTTSSGYSVSTGPGGLILAGSASITNSNVYVNGTITLQGSSSIGTQANPVTVDAGNIACPTGSNPGSSYPELCAGDSQPISMDYSTAIWGTVCATGQISTGPNNNIQGGKTGSGLQIGCTAPAVAQPTYNRSNIISAIPDSNVFSGTSGSYACSGNSSISLSPNTELTGNSVTWGNSCNITVNGNVYIPGNLTIDGAATITTSSTVGSTRPVVLVDGTITVGGSASFIANSSGTGIDFVSFKNCISGTDIACDYGASNPSATPTGTDLYNSQHEVNVSVGGAASSAGMVFDAYWSEVSLTGSGRIGAAAGQTVYLDGAGTVIFGTSLSSGAETWSITSYQLISS